MASGLRGAKSGSPVSPKKSIVSLATTLNELRRHPTRSPRYDNVVSVHFVELIFGRLFSMTILI
eukprot:scaffold41176_cov237-Amphora_coffeaeformis.AAC.1